MSRKPPKYHRTALKKPAPFDWSMTPATIMNKPTDSNIDEPMYENRHLGPQFSRLHAEPAGEILAGLADFLEADLLADFLLDFFVDFFFAIEPPLYELMTA
jgi:hypothetical protein